MNDMIFFSIFSFWILKINLRPKNSFLVFCMCVLMGSSHMPPHNQPQGDSGLLFLVIYHISMPH